MVQKHTLVAGVGIGAHLEHDVHDGSCLRNLPVDSGRSCGRRCAGEVDDKVAHAPEEVVLVHVPLCAATTGDIGIRVWEENNRCHPICSFQKREQGARVLADDSHASEGRISKQCGRGTRITDEDSVIVSAVSSEHS